MLHVLSILVIQCDSASRTQKAVGIAPSLLTSVCKKYRSVSATCLLTRQHFTLPLVLLDVTQGCEPHPEQTLSFPELRLSLPVIPLRKASPNSAGVAYRRYLYFCVHLSVFPPWAAQLKCPLTCAVTATACSQRKELPTWALCRLLPQASCTAAPGCHGHMGLPNHSYARVQANIIK